MNVGEIKAWGCIKWICFHRCCCCYIFILFSFRTSLESQFSAVIKDSRMGSSVADTALTMTQKTGEKELSEIQPWKIIYDVYSISTGSHKKQLSLFLKTNLNSSYTFEVYSFWSNSWDSGSYIPKPPKEFIVILWINVKCESYNTHFLSKFLKRHSVFQYIIFRKAGKVLVNLLYKNFGSKKSCLERI